MIPHDGRLPRALAAREVALLAHLLSRAGRPVPRDELLREVWRVRSRTTRALDMCVRRLRTCLERDPARPDHLLTVKGVGYRFDPHVPPADPGHVPAPLTPLYGRDEVVDLLVARIEAGRRLLTITAAPGIGKTRTALELAARASLRGTHGVWFCELADAHAEPELRAAVTETLGAAPGHLDAALKQQGTPLLVLDNLEQAVGPARATIAAWLRASAATFVVTSRALLGMPGEDEVRLEPLALDAAVRLIRSRAGPPWAHAGDDALADLAERLGRVPLALELAAARSHGLEPAEVAAALDQGLGVLGRSGAGPDRHRSYEAALEGSWRLLSAPARAVLRELAVFVRGATLPAARQVLALPDGVDVADVLEELVRQSLVVRARGPDGEVRFRLPQPIRPFVEARAGAPSDATAARHRAWARALADSWTTGPVVTRRATMVAEAGNLKRALAATHEPDEAALLLAGLRPWVNATGEVPWHAAEIGHLLARPGLSVEWRCRLRVMRAELDIRRHAGGRLDLEEALADAQPAHAHLVPRILRSLAYVDLREGHTASAAAHLQRALDLHPHVDAERGMLLKHLATTRLRQGLLDEVDRLTGELLRTARRSGDALGECNALVDLVAKRQEGRERTETLERAVALLDRHPSVLDQLHAVHALIESLCEEGRTALALPWAEWGLAAGTRAGLPEDAALCGANLGLALVVLGRGEEAVARLEPVLRLDARHPVVQFAVRFASAVAELARGRLAEARALLRDADGPARVAGRRWDSLAATARAAVDARLAGDGPVPFESPRTLEERALAAALTATSSPPRP